MNEESKMFVGCNNAFEKNLCLLDEKVRYLNSAIGRLGELRIKEPKLDAVKEGIRKATEPTHLELYSNNINRFQDLIQDLDYQISNLDRMI